MIANRQFRLAAVALLAPALGGCAASAAMQAIPAAIGATAMAKADHRDLWIRYDPNLKTATERDMEALGDNIHRAECGDPASQFWLAAALQNGFNTNPNNIEIFKWYRLAELGEYAPASEQVAALSATMPPEEIGEAEARAAAWRPALDSCPIAG